MGSEGRAHKVMGILRFLSRMSMLNYKHGLKK